MRNWGFHFFHPKGSTKLFQCHDIPQQLGYPAARWASWTASWQWLAVKVWSTNMARLNWKTSKLTPKTLENPERIEGGFFAWTWHFFRGSMSNTTPRPAMRERLPTVDSLGICSGDQFWEIYVGGDDMTRWKAGGVHGKAQGNHHGGVEIIFWSKEMFFGETIFYIWDQMVFFSPFFCYIFLTKPNVLFRICSTEKRKGLISDLVVGWRPTAHSMAWRRRGVRLVCIAKGVCTKPIMISTLFSTWNLPKPDNLGAPGISPVQSDELHWAARSEPRDRSIVVGFGTIRMHQVNVKRPKQNLCDSGHDFGIGLPFLCGSSREIDT